MRTMVVNCHIPVDSFIVLL